MNIQLTPKTLLILSVIYIVAKACSYLIPDQTESKILLCLRKLGSFISLSFPNMQGRKVTVKQIIEYIFICFAFVIFVTPAHAEEDATMGGLASRIPLRDNVGYHCNFNQTEIRNNSTMNNFVTGGWEIGKTFVNMPLGIASVLTGGSVTSDLVGGSRLEFGECQILPDAKMILIHRNSTGDTTTLEQNLKGKTSQKRRGSTTILMSSNADTKTIRNAFEAMNK